MHAPATWRFVLPMPDAPLSGTGPVLPQRHPNELSGSMVGSELPQHIQDAGWAEVIPQANLNRITLRMWWSRQKSASSSVGTSIRTIRTTARLLDSVAFRIRPLRLMFAMAGRASTRSARRVGGSLPAVGEDSGTAANAQGAPTNVGALGDGLLPLADKAGPLVSFSAPAVGGELNPWIRRGCGPPAKAFPLAELGEPR